MSQVWNYLSFSLEHEQWKTSKDYNGWKDRSIRVEKKPKQGEIDIAPYHALPRGILQFGFLVLWFSATFWAAITSQERATVAPQESQRHCFWPAFCSTNQSFVPLGSPCVVPLQASLAESISSSSTAPCSSLGAAPSQAYPSAHGKGHTSLLFHVVPATELSPVVRTMQAVLLPSHCLVKPPSKT